MRTFGSAVIAVLILSAFFVATAVADETKAADAEAVRRLIRQLGSEDFEEREQAAKQLIARGPAVLEALEAARRAKDPEIARKAWECMRQIDPSLEIKPQILAWIKQLRSPDLEVRHRAGDGLFALGPKLAPFVPNLIEVLDDPDLEVRSWAAVALAHVGPKAEQAIPKLLRMLKDQTPGTNEHRMHVMQALEGIDTCGRQTVPILLHILETEEPQMQMFAASSLGKLGAEDARVGPALLKSACDKGNWEVQRTALWSLAQLRKEPEKAVPILVQYLRTRPFATRDNAELHAHALIRCLGEYGPLAEPAIPCLVEIFKDHKRDPSVRKGAINTLYLIGPVAHKEVPRLKDLKEPISARALEEILQNLGKD